MRILTIVFILCFNLTYSQNKLPIRLFSEYKKELKNDTINNETKQYFDKLKIGTLKLSDYTNDKQFKYFLISYEFDYIIQESKLKIKVAPKFTINIITSKYYNFITYAYKLDMKRRYKLFRIYNKHFERIKYIK